MRTGLELELLAPVGQTRFDLARSLAASTGGELRFGLKHVVDGFLPGPEQRPRCSLSLAARVSDREGRAWASIVDDVTIRDDLTSEVGDEGAPLAIVDDTRIAKWLEARASSAAPAIDDVIAPLVDTFGASTEPFDGGRRIIDRWGQVLALVVTEPRAHWRVAEVVTAPLEDAARADVVGLILEHAHTLGFTIPRAAALHVHVDGVVWQDTARLCAFIRNWSARRDDVMMRLRPNPACKKLGAFPENVVRVARECPPDLPFAQLAAALKLAGAKKELDVNLLGVIDRHPVQPTLEVRCLPMSMDASAVLASINEALALLEELSR